MARFVAISTVLALSFVLLLRATCAPPDIPPAYRSFFKVPFNEQPDSLRTFPPGDQIEIYLLYPAVSHPGHPGLVSVVAENGPAILPLILPRLTAADESDPEMRDLFYVLGVMVCEHGHSLAGDTTLMRVVSEAAARSPYAVVERSMARIRTDCRDE